MRQHTVHDQTGPGPGQNSRGSTENAPENATENIAGHITGPAPERARTVLAMAGSAGVIPSGRHEPPVSVWLTEHDGRLMVQATGERCSTALRDAARSPQPSGLEVADVAPLPLRSRIRARVRLEGSLVAAEPHVGLLWHFLPDEAWLDLDDETHHVGLAELADARPDPFARFEPGLLAHLESAHADVVDALTRLADPRVADHATRIRPLLLNRYGLALRVEYQHDHRDVHVPFPGPVDTGQGLTCAMRALVHDAGAAQQDGAGRSARRGRRR
ncbi:MAG TPA: DUF2470 domain-containing protein [Nocardioidaceae bacterium]|nr:DUF2470 domain-containing protein [Nocardioidaceae bacterium]